MWPLASTPVHWRFPKYVQLRTNGYVTAFHLLSLYFLFKFQIFLFSRGFILNVCLYIYNFSF